MCRVGQDAMAVLRICWMFVRMIVYVLVMVVDRFGARVKQVG